MPPELRLLARRQGGCLSYAQLLAGGLTVAKVRTLLGRGLLERILPRVYVLAGAPGGQRMRSHAALLQYGPEAGLSHLSAGARWSITGPADRVVLTVPHDHHVRDVPSWLHVHRTRHLELVRLDNTSLTPCVRTVIDLAAVLSERELDAVFLRVVQKKLVTADEVARALEQLGPRPGAARVRRVLVQYDPGFESRLSKEFWELVVRAGYPQAELNLVIDLLDGSTARPDVGLRTIGQGFEADGLGPHGPLAAQTHDKRRDRKLAAVGWAVARFVTEDIQRWKRQTIREVQQIVRAREREVGRLA